MKHLIIAVALSLIAVPALAAQPYQLTPNGVIIEATGATVPDDPRNADWQRYQAWVAAGNTADPAPAPSAAQQAQATYNATLGAGLAIACASGATVCTTAINGTYPVSAAISVQIDGIYASIKGGDGLPGGGTTFNWPDASGAMHAFTAAQFTAFAKAYRDFVYSATQAEATAAGGGTATWPTAAATLQ